jgi:peptide/nickel transport system permease protein
VTHLSIALRRLEHSRRATFAITLLGVLALVGIFAEVLASDAPLLGGGVDRAALGAIGAPASGSCAPATELAPPLPARGSAPGLWPIVRWGPSTRTDADACAPASREHPLGTDARGRDLAARLVYGARNALGLALGASLLGALLGVALGGLAGTYRGFWNERLVRLVETVDTFPAILVVALLRAIEREPSATSLVVAVALVRWAEVARLVRVEVLRASAEDYVIAARALGGSPARVFWRHVLPNALGPVLVSSVFGIGAVVLLEAAVSFLGMGPQTSAASWGEILAEGAQHPTQLRLLLLPGLLLLATVAASYLLADALRDALDPRGEPAPPPRPTSLARDA